MYSFYYEAIMVKLKETPFLYHIRCRISSSC